MEVIRIKSRIGRLKGKAYVDGVVVAEAEVMFSLVERDAAKAS
jgi:3-hydroxymyristoyl/3-hydroxydecanoyl-(acyl carrier protein) dehydratase